MLRAFNVNNLQQVQSVMAAARETDPPAEVAPSLTKGASMKHPITAFFLAACSAAASAAATPPPTNVRASSVVAIDATTASFVLEWSPAVGPDGRPYAKYVISSMCKYQGVPGGGSVTGANGGQIEWTGPPFKVRATCSCLGKTPAWPVLTQQPNAYAHRSVPVYAARFQLPCVQPARGPF